MFVPFFKKGDDNIANRKYNLNENYFEQINNEENAYWLGFIYADGFVSHKQLIIELSSKDNEHLRKFINCLNANYPIKKIRKNNKEYSRIEIGSIKLVNDLNKLGCMTKKSLILKFPTLEQVPKNLQIHFMRGYFDGDGTLSVSEGYRTRNDCNNKKYHYKAWCFKVLGTYEFLEEYSKNLNVVQNKILHNNNPNKNSFNLKFGGKNKINYILEKLYNNSTIYLDRKYEKYLEFKKDTNKQPI